MVQNPVQKKNIAICVGMVDLEEGNDSKRVIGGLVQE